MTWITQQPSNDNAGEFAASPLDHEPERTQRVLKPAAYRDELVRQGLAVVYSLAFRIVKRLPPNVSVGDLLGAGTEGLLHAVARYDPERSPHFMAFVRARVYGAMIDEMRVGDPLTRWGRRRTNRITRATRALQHSLKRSPTEDEVAQHLGLTLDEYYRWIGRGMYRPTLQDMTTMSGAEADSETFNIEHALIERESRRQLARAVRELPLRTQQILTLYYEDERTQMEIAEIMGVTESRICQILSEAAAQLRVLLRESPLEHAKRSTPRLLGSRSLRGERCTRCKNAAMPGKKRCKSCRAYAQARMRALRARKECRDEIHSIAQA